MFKDTTIKNQTEFSLYNWPRHFTEEYLQLTPTETMVLDKILGEEPFDGILKDHSNNIVQKSLKRTFKSCFDVSSYMGFLKIYLSWPDKFEERFYNLINEEDTELLKPLVRNGIIQSQEDFIATAVINNLPTEHKGTAQIRAIGLERLNDWENPGEILTSLIKDDF